LDHAWRGHEDGQPTKKMHRRFRGARSDRQEASTRNEQAQAGILTDRKGRPVAVERYPRTSPTGAVRQNDRGLRRKSHRRRRPAAPRSSSPPRRPRDKS
jgi:hypothetical protein